MKPWEETWAVAVTGPTNTRALAVVSPVETGQAWPTWAKVINENKETEGRLLLAAQAPAMARELLALREQLYRLPNEHGIGMAGIDKVLSVAGVIP